MTSAPKLHQDDKDSNYSATGIHNDMIQDKYRTLTYCKAIENNAASFKDKVVLDVGSGTGILSLFAARSGAKKVYAVECTPIGYTSEEIISANHFENIITVVHGRLEEVEIPEKVDIIISEWMGYALYFEVMLPSVIFARNKYLNPNGALLPSRAKLFMSGMEDVEYRCTQIDFWDNVYGFDFSAMKRKALSEPVVDTCEKWQLMTNTATLHEINIHECDEDACFFKSNFDLTCNLNQSMTAFAIWFDVYFEDFPSKHTLSTSPLKKSTHWQQTMLYLKDPLDVKKNDHVKGNIEFQENPNDGGGLIILLEYQLNDGPVIKQDFDFR
ncbi:Protein arginine N-methyltransferase 8 [Tritrichomonas foetus]|uniref:type I protein arginine methyltransferase n=1 Tax=Tritrichomonas foetus TaxID=1144522 RepID=A0A1J4KEL2_9EUKA|nr:Protein arginine N-methyltransferase 8 [Tritrichomonas foetus]|eukprot:OHT08038.1 Protein arginine N-methyltransferase 8 [Tritrichomonas foetus]